MSTEYRVVKLRGKYPYKIIGPDGRIHSAYETREEAEAHKGKMMTKED